MASGQVLSALAALVSIRIMTELLPPEEFGRLTLLLGAAALALGLAATPRLQGCLQSRTRAGSQRAQSAMRSAVPSVEASSTSQTLRTPGWPRALSTARSRVDSALKQGMTTSSTGGTLTALTLSARCRAWIPPGTPA